MRKIEKAMCEAVKNHRNWSLGNTDVDVYATAYGGYRVEVLLHGNLIYRYNSVEDFAEFTLAGWDTATTRSRLCALGATVRHTNKKPYYKGHVIDKNEWYEV